MRKYKQAILPFGFKASAISCGIKKSGRTDLALFFSTSPAKASCLFTTNSIAAAPVILDKQRLKSGTYFQAIIANSGNANAFTGRLGLKDAQDISRSLAHVLGLNNGRILVASTGIIARRLPVARIKLKLPQLAKKLSPQGIHAAKKAIMTTDTFAKEFSVKFNLGGKTVTICGIAKGAGMIAPKMATLLGFIFTDAHIAPGALKQALKIAVEDSFNCITVDGCMSTNDSVMLLANGLAANTLIRKGKNLELFMRALNSVCLELAKMVVRDAEGASKFIQINVSSAVNYRVAKAVALSIANSNLLKTAVYGENPNFGRIVAAIGASGVRVREEGLKIKVSSLKKRDISISVSLNQGEAQATAYTSDLTPEYVKINAEYS